MQRFLPMTRNTTTKTCAPRSRSPTLATGTSSKSITAALFDVGSDQETVAYGIRQKDNWAATIWAEANLQNWYTDTQWLPRLDYYRLGDSLVNNHITYFTHSGLDYANTHTDNMVNNKNLFGLHPVWTRFPTPAAF